MSARRGSFLPLALAVAAALVVAVVLSACGGGGEGGGEEAVATEAGNGAGPSEVFTVAVDKFGHGTITSSPDGIQCGDDCTSQSATYPSGATVVLEASPDEGSEFSHWSGCDSTSEASCTVKVDADRIVFVSFAFSEAIIPETTKVLDDATMQYLTRQEASTYYFDPRAEAVAGLDVGDVIVASAGEGLLRKVTAVRVTDEEIAVETAPATLADAIERGTIILHQTLTPADLQSSRILVSAAVPSAGMPGPASSPFTITLDKELAPGIDISGTLDFEAELDIGIEFDWWDVSEARAILTFQTNTSVTLSAGHTFEMSKEMEIWSHEFPWITVWVPFPVVFIPGLAIDVGIEGHAGAAAECGATAQNTFTVGVRYDEDSGWSRVLLFDPSFGLSDAGLSADAEVKGYVAPRLTVEVYGIVGPYFGLEGFLRLSADINETPWWSLYAGLSALAGFEVEVLDLDLADYSWPVWTQEWLLAQAQTAVHTLTLNTTGHGIVTGEPADIYCSAGDVCSETYNEGTTVTLTAEPYSGLRASWSGCDESSGNTCTVTMSADKTVSVSFTSGATPPPGATPTPPPGTTPVGPGTPPSGTQVAATGTAEPYVTPGEEQRGGGAIEEGGGGATEKGGGGSATEVPARGTAEPSPPPDDNR
jgi:hypothetical protein